MYKLQIVLVPPRALEYQPYTIFSLNNYPNINKSFLASNTSKFINTSDYNFGNKNNTLSNDITINNIKENKLTLINNIKHMIKYKEYQYKKNCKKILLFTNKNNNLLQLSDDILNKINKLYSNLNEEIDILSIKDKDGNDLDPDYIVGDIFNVNNIVIVNIDKDIDWNSTTTISEYQSIKRRRSYNALTERKFDSIQIPKKRNINNSNLNHKRSTSVNVKPSLNIINEKENHTLSNNNSTLTNRSILPPPKNSQPSPIRISPAISNNKKLTSNELNNLSSQPDKVDSARYLHSNNVTTKNKEEQLLGTPVVSVITPSKLTSSEEKQYIATLNKHGCNNNYAGNNTGNHLKVNNSNKNINDMDNSNMNSVLHHASFTPKISITEPQIIDQLLESDKTPIDVTEEEIGNIRVTETTVQKNKFERCPTTRKVPLQRTQSSIANDKGSPIRNSPLFNNLSQQVHLAELPEKTPLSKSKSIYEKIMEQQNEIANENSLKRKKKDEQQNVAENKPRTRNILNTNRMVEDDLLKKEKKIINNTSNELVSEIDEANIITTTENSLTGKRACTSSNKNTPSQHEEIHVRNALKNKINSLKKISLIEKISISETQNISLQIPSERDVESIKGLEISTPSENKHPIPDIPPSLLQTTIHATKEDELTKSAEYNVKSGTSVKTWNSSGSITKVSTDLSAKRNNKLHNNEKNSNGTKFPTSNLSKPKKDEPSFNKTKLKEQHKSSPNFEKDSKEKSFPSNNNTQTKRSKPSSVINDDDNSNNNNISDNVKLNSQINEKQDLLDIQKTSKEGKIGIELNSSIDNTNKLTSSVQNQQKMDGTTIQNEKDKHCSLGESDSNKDSRPSLSLSIPITENSNSKEEIGKTGNKNNRAKMNDSFSKSDLMDMLEKNNSSSSSWLSKGKISKPSNTERIIGKPRKKPYVTVLFKDIDNSKPDPRNILPSRMPRNAAKIASQKISGVSPMDEGDISDNNNDEEVESYDSSSSSSGIFTDLSSDEEQHEIRPFPFTELAEEFVVPLPNLKERVVNDDLLEELKNESKNNTLKKQVSAQNEKIQEKSDLNMNLIPNSTNLVKIHKQKAVNTTEPNLEKGDVQNDTKSIDTANMTLLELDKLSNSKNSRMLFSKQDFSISSENYKKLINVSEDCPKQYLSMDRLPNYNNNSFIDSQTVHSDNSSEELSDLESSSSESGDSLDHNNNSDDDLLNDIIGAKDEKSKEKSKIVIKKSKKEARANNKTSSMLHSSSNNSKFKGRIPGLEEITTTFKQSTNFAQRLERFNKNNDLLNNSDNDDNNYSLSETEDDSSFDVEKANSGSDSNDKDISESSSESDSDSESESDSDDDLLEHLSVQTAKSCLTAR